MNISAISSPKSIPEYLEQLRRALGKAGSSNPAAICSQDILAGRRGREPTSAAVRRTSSLRR